MARNFLIFLAILAFEFSYLEAAPNSDMSRIFNGQDAAVGQFPHQITLLLNGNLQCGGSILNKRYILTAAHCLVYKGTTKPIPANILQIRAGSVSRSSGGQIFDVKRTIVHENYRPLDDIALIELENPLEWSDNVKPIEMATEEVSSSEDVVVSGWGRTSFIAPYPDHLKWTTLKSITTKECLKSWNDIDDRVICLSSPVGTGVCFADSGGPATHMGKLVGITSFGAPCANRKPDVFTKVFSYRNWILEKINEKDY